MGDITDMILNGDMCQCCGVWINDGDGNGYPEKCPDCSNDDEGTK